MTLSTPSQAEHRKYISYLEQLQAGDQASAASGLRQLHCLRPDWLEPLLALVELALSNSSIIEAAERQHLLQKLQTPPREADPRSLFLLAKDRIVCADIEQAIHFLHKACEIQPNFDLGNQQLAALLLQKERWAEAEEILRAQLKSFPDQAHLLTNLSVALLRQNRLEDALTLAERALSQAEPDQLASVHVNLGTILQELGRRQEAQKHYKKTLSLAPEHINARLNLGVIALQDKNFTTAENYFRETLALQPNDARASVNLAGLLLLQDRAEEGWAYYERRVHEESTILAQPNQLPRWQGEPLQGSLVLVHEQGLGDTFQFIRYAKLLQTQGLRCHFRGPQKLHGLIQDSGLVFSCHTPNEALPRDASAWIALMSLAPLLGASVQQPLTSGEPYFNVDQARVERWQSLLGPRKGLRLALHWQGNPDHEFTISRGRSLCLDELSPLLSIPGVEWISLQKGPGSEQAEQGTFADCWHSQQPSINAAWDFEDAAAILKCCDGLVSSDSGLAHLAGAIGTRVWLMLPWLAEWRWGLKGSKCTWYQNHSLLRQQIENDWDAPIQSLLQEIKMAQNLDQHIV